MSGRRFKPRMGEGHDKGLFFVRHQNFIKGKFEVVLGWANSTDFAELRAPVVEALPRIGVDLVI